MKASSKDADELVARLQALRKVTTVTRTLVVGAFADFDAEDARIVTVLATDLETAVSEACRAVIAAREAQRRVNAVVRSATRAYRVEQSRPAPHSRRAPAKKIRASRGVA